MLLFNILYIILAILGATAVSVFLLLILGGGSLREEPVLVQEYPVVSIIVPSYNESRLMERKLKELLLLDYPEHRLEIIVVDESIDDTPDIVSSMMASHPGRIRLYHFPERLGLAQALNFGYTHARGSIIVKTDCDSEILERAALRIAASFLGSDSVGVLTGNYVPDKGAERIYRKALSRLQIAESNAGSTIIGHGAFVAFKKSVYRGLNPNSLADDTELMLDICSQGYRSLMIPSIVVREEHPSRFYNEIKQRSRRAGGILGLLLRKYRHMFLNPRYKTTGLAIIPLEFLMIAIVPVLGLAAMIILAILAYEVGTLLYVALALFLLVLVTAVPLRRGKLLLSLLIIPLSGLIGLFMLAFRHNGVYNKVRE